MVVTTIFVIFPLALTCAIVYTKLFFKGLNLFRRIKKSSIRVLIKIVAYTVMIAILSIALTGFAFALLVGIIGIPLLLLWDTAGLIILIKYRKELREY